MQAPIAGKRQIELFKNLSEQTRRFVNAWDELMELKRMRDDGHFPFNSGSNPQYEVSDAEAQKLGYADASSLDNMISDWQNQMNGIEGNNYMSAFRAVASIDQP